MTEGGSAGAALIGVTVLNTAPSKSSRATFAGGALVFSGVLLAERS